jgi:hypothetical protein
MKSGLFRSSMNALIELQGARQTNGEGPRRWFTSSAMDSIERYDDHSSAGFGLYYDESTKEHVLIWDAGSDPDPEWKC